ncbi:MAG: MaoC family dehydratase [Alphaproteobacteria bacterium]
MADKTNPGRLFEDFRVGQELRHAPPRTMTRADQTLYIALTGARFPLHCSDEFARRLGCREAPLDDLLVFNIVFGRTVADISQNAVANLGYHPGRFGVPVYPGDTLGAGSTVIGLKETSRRQSGVVYVRSAARNQRGESVLDYVRAVLVPKRDQESPAPEAVVPDLPDAVPPSELGVPAGLDLSGYDAGESGSPFRWDDYLEGERIDHVDGMTIEESDHMTATRLYQNSARAHFDELRAKSTRFGRRLVYGGHVMSVARALSFNGLANAFRIASINGGGHLAPVFAGDTIYAWSEVLEKARLAGRADAGALRLRTVALKNRTAARFPRLAAGGGYESDVVLQLDYTVLVPR